MGLLHWYRFLQEQLDHQIEQIDTNSLALVRAIWGIGNPFIITANYDRSLFWSCPNQNNFSRWDIENVVKQGQFLSNGLPEEPTVWHLHGHIDNPEKIILTLDGYLKLYPGKQRKIEYEAALDTLRSIIKSYSLLFIGFSLNYTFINEQLKYVNNLYQGAIGPHYALTCEDGLSRIEGKNLPVTPIKLSRFGQPLIDKINEIADLADSQSSVKTQIKRDEDPPLTDIVSFPAPQRLESKTNPELPKPSLALVMKGGGVEGLAYVGALKELQKYYNFYWFVGTSAGAIAAVLLAAGYTADELEEILRNKHFLGFLDKKPRALFKLIFYGGLFEARTFTKWIDELLSEKHKNFGPLPLEKLPKRVTVYASRRYKKALIYDSQGNKKNTSASFATRCSMSIPFIFLPQRDEGLRVLDGGMQNNYPVEQLLV